MFEITRDKLKEYVGKDATKLYDKVKADATNRWESVKKVPGMVKKVWGKR